ncbi:apolipoprotein N-acyltransferase [soil metagenome]
MVTAPAKARRPPNLAWLLAMIAGAAAGLAHPPFGFLPGLLGYGLIMLLADGADHRRPLRSAFWRGWLAGLSYFAVSVWWVTEAFFVDAETFGWMAPIAICLLAGGLALFWGLAALLYRRIGATGVTRVLVFAGALSLVEWVRGWIFTGFPWDLPGETWLAGSAPSQMASVVGASGLTLFTVAIAAAPAVLLDDAPRRPRLIAVSLAALALAGLYGYGAVRLARPAPLTNILVRVVQPDIAESAKYDAASFRDNANRFLALTAQPAARTPDIIVWSEAALAPATIEDLLSPQAWTRPAIAAALKPGQTLLMGGIRMTGPPDKPTYLNSLFAVSLKDGAPVVTATYDKYRLVPFGEFLPLGKYLDKIGFRKLVPLGDFGAGPEPRPIGPPGIPALQPLICYESLFPGYTRRGARAGGRRAEWIVNVSNDSWFGQTSGPRQHLNLASYRAIEEGLPMVRATPTGISAVIDPYGRVLPGARVALGTRGVVDAFLPKSAPLTPYAKYGELFFMVTMLLTLSVAVRHFVRSN